jgi:hypothetical protein
MAAIAGDAAEQTDRLPPEIAIRDRRRPLLISACMASFEKTLALSLNRSWREGKRA